MPSRFSPLAQSAKSLARSALPVLVLLAIAGSVDAQIMLHSKDLLAVYMTGNSTKLGQSLVNGAWGKAGPLLGVIACFLVSTTVAAWLGSRLPAWRGALVLFLTALSMGVASALAVALVADQYSLLITCLVACAMGAINQVRVDEPGVTFITGNLIRVGREFAEGEYGAAALGLARWAAFVVGAVFGTLLDRLFNTGALAIVASFTFACAVVTTLFTATSAHAGEGDDAAHRSLPDGGINRVRE